MDFPKRPQDLTRRQSLILFVITVVLCGNDSMAFASEDENQLGFYLDATWVSKFIWYGQDFFDNHASFQPSLDEDLFNTGFSLNVWAWYASSSGFVDVEGLAYSATYTNSLFAGNPYQTDYSLTGYYYDYTDAPSINLDSQELLLNVSGPEMCPFGMTPSYGLSYLWTARSGGPAAAMEMEGFYHVFGLDYDLQLAKIENPLTLHWDIAYNDGQGGTAFDHDWSHMTWAVSTTFGNHLGGTWTPQLYYQTSMDRSVNSEDEFWVGMSYGFGF